MTPEQQEACNKLWEKLFLLTNEDEAEKFLNEITKFKDALYQKHAWIHRENLLKKRINEVVNG